MNSRLISFQVIDTIITQKSNLHFFDQIIQEIPNLQKDDPDIYLIKQTTYGVFRHWFQFERFIKQYHQKRLKRKVKIILFIALYQSYIHQPTLPTYAVIDECVKALKKISTQYEANFLNAILRKIQTHSNLPKAPILTQIQTQPSLPEWLMEKLKHAYNTDEVEEITTAFLSPPKLFIRPLTLLSDFSEFDVQKHTIQDPSAQYAGQIINPKYGECILDACAAPGGKTTHLLELCPNIQLTAIDIQPNRLAKVHENLKRLNLPYNSPTVKLECADLSQPLNNLQKEQQFDKILLDAPCSALGVIKRQPDIRLLRTEKDVTQATCLQMKILNNLWSYLKRGGQLLYVTCSILPEENENQMTLFLEKNTDAKRLDIELLDGEKSNVRQQKNGYQILPDENRDGFYYCLLIKASLD